MTLEHNARDESQIMREDCDWRRASASGPIPPRQRRAKSDRRQGRASGEKKRLPRECSGKFQRPRFQIVECPLYCVIGLAPFVPFQTFSNYSNNCRPPALHCSDRKTNRAFAVAHFIPRRPRCSHAGTIARNFGITYERTTLSSAKTKSRRVSRAILTLVATKESVDT